MSIETPTKRFGHGQTNGANARHDAQIRRRQTVRLAAIGALVILALALAVDNSKRVTISYIVGSTTGPLVIALVVAFALGLVVGSLAMLRHQR